MPSIFPQLLTFGLVTPLFFRIALAVTAILAAKNRYSKPYKWLSIPYALTALFLGIGLFVQVAALVGMILLTVDWSLESKAGPLSQSHKISYALLGLILFSLLFSGPGFIAIDFPL